MYNITDYRKPSPLPEPKEFLTLFFIMITLFCIGLCSCHAEEYTDNEIADAIYKAENSVKYPYGIKSIDTHGNKEYARKICLNTIKNNRKRLANQTKFKDFIEFLGSRYCPTTIPSEYYLNKNWVKNVKYYLKKGRSNGLND